MNCIEDEPRKVPKPVPFSERSSIQPTVPEVSLLLQDSTISPKIAPNSSFTGTEFQTYNAWRWKNVNEREKENLSKRCYIQNKKQDFFPINDKFSGSEIEKRKNEILYGSVEEPRRPLPPRPIPVIPNCIGASFSDVSFSSELWNSTETESKKQTKSSHIDKYNFEDDNSEVRKSARGGSYEDQKDMKDLYQIIADQNKQMVFLQKQIEQLLKSQESKEKQIEQLLKSQETKDNKIEQLLKMQDLKENHIEQLIKAQEKHEKQIEQMIMAQEAREEQYINISKKLRSLDKEFVTVGTMTTIDVDVKSTNTSFRCVCKDEQHENSSEKTESFEDYIQCQTGDKSFTLHSLDLPAVQEHIPSPQNSIHVDIPEYNSSSDEDSDIFSRNNEVQIHNLLETKPLGYTFYNNVLTQVNDIIHNHEDGTEEARKLKINNANMKLEKELQGNYFEENTMKTTHSLGSDIVQKQWEIKMHEPQTDFQFGAKTADNNCNNNGASSELQMMYNSGMTKDTQSPSDVSLRMNALALKYLKQDQISQYEMQFQTQPSSKQPDVTIYNVTNLSFGTMRYLERYRISSHNVGQSNEGFHSRHQFLQQKAKTAMRNCNYMNM